MASARPALGRLQVPAAGVRLDGYIVDFVCTEQRLVVEIDGGQHVGAARGTTSSGQLELESLGFSRSCDTGTMTCWFERTRPGRHLGSSCDCPSRRHPSPASGARASPRRRGAGAHGMTRTTQWVYGWLLLLPAMALLVLFTHYPAVATLWHSFFSTPKGSRPLGLRRRRQLPAARRGPGLLAGAVEQLSGTRSARYPRPSSSRC